MKLPTARSRGIQKARLKRNEVKNKLEALGCDPIEGMALIAMAKHEALGLVEVIPASPGQEARIERVQEIPIELRAAMYRELAQYVYPKRRAVDVTAGEGGGEITVQTISFSEAEIMDESNTD